MIVLWDERWPQYMAMKGGGQLIFSGTQVGKTSLNKLLMTAYHWVLAHEDSHKNDWRWN